MSDEKQKEEKKGGKVSGFFKNLGNKINDATYDMRAESDFNKNHPKYTVYTGSGLLAHTADLYAEEHFGGEVNYILAPSEDEEIKAGHVIVNDESGEAKYIAAVEKDVITYVFEEKSNEKPALKITLGEPAEKVEVIKVNDDYYLKK